MNKMNNCLPVVFQNHFMLLEISDPFDDLPTIRVSSIRNTDLKNDDSNLDVTEILEDMIYLGEITFHKQITCGVSSSRLISRELIDLVISKLTCEFS